MIQPSNIYCLALNYAGVGVTAETPLYFVKSSTSFCHDQSSVRWPVDASRMWAEVELGIVVGEDCRNVPAEYAFSYVEGFVVCGDVSCENIFARDHHLGFSKSRENFCPTSAEIISVSEDQVQELKLTTKINDRVTQVGVAADMVYGPAKCLSYISSLIPLKKGDLILTGTPSGVENNELAVGDHVEHHIDKVGSVSFKVV